MDPFVAEIRIFGGNFAPAGWAFCDGQLLPISQNTALFSLIGTFYGGNGITNFGLPNLQGSSPMHQGQGIGLTDRVLGESGGAQFVTLQEMEIPAHNHSFLAAPSGALSVPTNNIFGGAAFGRPAAYAPSGSGGLGNVLMSPSALARAGGGLPHNNMPPYLCMTFIIALQGIFPPRS
jgi:microcystin-dependent protein